jgi:SAM-dependent methyltransferase
VSGPSRRFFDLWSRVYDAPLVQRVVYRPVQDAIMKALGDPARVLDVGCGTGLLTARLARERPTAAVTGLDFSFGMLEQAAASRAAPATWVQGDAMRLPFASGTFGAITCTESFHWYPDQAAALREFHRVLGAGGRLFVALVNPRTVAASRVGDAASQLAGQPAHWPSRREMRELVERAGFSVERQSAVYRPPAPMVLGSVLTIAMKRQLQG